MKNLFISQLEDEIAKAHPIRHIIETRDYALLVNDSEKDYLLKNENEQYINRITDTYLRCLK